MSRFITLSTSVAFAVALMGSGSAPSSAALGLQPNESTPRATMRPHTIQPHAATGTRYLPWYDSIATQGHDWILLSSLNAPVTVSVTIGGGVRGTYAVAAHGTTPVVFPDLKGGPVILTPISGDVTHFRASERVLYGASSLSELPTPTVADVSGDHYFPWYDSLVTQGHDWIVVGNLTSENATVTIWVAGVRRFQGPLPANGVIWPVLYGVRGGPVLVEATDANGNLVATTASQRNVFNGPTLNEVWGIPVAPGSLLTLSNEYVFPRYDATRGPDYLLLANVSSQNESVRVLLGTRQLQALTLSPGQVTYPIFWGLVGGPLHVVSSGPIVASQRTLLGGMYFNETLGQPVVPLTQAQVGSYIAAFTWFDDEGAYGQDSVYCVTGNQEVDVSRGAVPPGVRFGALVGYDQMAPWQENLPNTFLPLAGKGGPIYYNVWPVNFNNINTLSSYFFCSQRTFWGGRDLDEINAMLE